MRNLFILRGAPGCGKSTWVKENNLEPYTLSTDLIRCLYQCPVTTVSGDREISQNNDSAVWRLLFELLERRMENGEFIIIDATHYKSSLISRYKDLVSKYRYRVNVVNFDITEEECLKRNRERESFKFVPEDVIKKMYACLHDDSEVKKAYKMITPDEAAEIANGQLQPVVIDEKYKSVVVFGDIHGCYTPIKDYFENYTKSKTIDDETVYIFCGDYIDRGIQNKEVLEFLLSIYKKPNVFLLEGNHEKWLRMYCSKDYVEVEKKENKYQDFYVSKIVEQLEFKKSQLNKKFNRNKNTMEEISKLLKESWNENPDNKEIFYEFEKINVPEKQQELSKQNSLISKSLETLQHYIYVLGHEKNNTSSCINACDNWYKETFNEGLSFNIKNIIGKKLCMKEDKFENPIKSAEFLNNTVPQIKDIDKAELRRLCDKFIQMSYFTFAGKTYLVTHGGLPCLPDIKTPTIDMIKGVGKYEGTVECEKSFRENVKDVIQIHGHRNIMKLPAVDEEWRNINLEGDVEFGGNLRVFYVSKCIDGSGVNSAVDEIKNNIYKKEEVIEVKEKIDLEVLKDMLYSKLIQVKNLEDNIISLNFTRDVFYDKKWNDLTCHARGLFVDKTNGQVVARSFSKFFNHGEVEQTKSSGLKETFKFPVIGYKKENGFLGIVSKYDGKIRFFTKSSDSGDYVNWFIGVLCDNYDIDYVGHAKYSDIYNQSLIEEDPINKISQLEALEQMKQVLKNKLNPLLEEGYSYVFECVDKDNDPHIIKYDKNKVVLLEVFKNQLKEEHLSWFELGDVEKKLGIPLKFKELEFNTWEDFEEWKDKFTTGMTQWDCKHEGYVFEDVNGFRVKFKSQFYRFWKQMRAVKDVLAGGRTNKKIYKTKEEIQVVKLLESYTREELKNMSIIDIEDKFYETYEG